MQVCKTYFAYKNIYIVFRVYTGLKLYHFIREIPTGSTKYLQDHEVSAIRKCSSDALLRFVDVLQEKAQFKSLLVGFRTTSTHKKIGYVVPLVSK